MKNLIKEAPGVAQSFFDLAKSVNEFYRPGYGDYRQNGGPNGWQQGGRRCRG